MKCDAQPSNDVHCFKMFYVVVIMLRGLSASFANQIQSEYYGGNISVSIEGIALEHFSVVSQTNINSTTPSRQCHAVFHSFWSDDSKQDAATTTAHINRFISLLKDKKVFTRSLNTIWKNSDGCAEQ